MRKAFGLFIAVIFVLSVSPILSSASQQGKPDLRIGEFKVMKVETKEVALRLEIFLSIKNSGNAAVDKNFVISLFYRTNPSDPWLKLEDLSSGPLGIDESAQFTKVFDFKKTETHFFKVELDANNEISESNKENNIGYTDTSQYAGHFEVLVTAPRMDIPLKENPAATTVVETEILSGMWKTVAADEAFKLSPGIKVDNQADGERVHLSIRGQGILTERGTRGIKTLVDGVPINDPSGYVSDFFDIDWATVNRVEVMRGPAAAFYGSGSSGGILNILTRDGGPEPISASAFLTSGSFGFYKGQAEAGGTSGPINYRVSGSYLSSDGYRDHTKYWADNFYGKFHFNPTPSVKLTAILGWTDFFNDNAEGLNLDWFSSDPSKYRKLANPDAYTLEEYQNTPLWFRQMFGLNHIPGNEYQRTGRFTSGIAGSIDLAPNLDLALSTCYRHTKYTESVPDSLIHRMYDTPGFSLQVNHHEGQGWLKNHLSVGSDLSWQSIDEYKHPNLGNAVEGSDFQSDQTMSQTGAGVFALDRVELGPQWGASLSLRYDRVTNKLDDHLKAGGVDLSSNVAYEKATGRLGVTWNPVPDFSLYASWGTGFLPPGTEELVNNPYAFGGFNTHLVAATSNGEEVGVRGSIKNSFIYDAALFYLSTENDFGRYRMASRPLETFYGNVGSTYRYGLETSVSWYPLEPLALRLAYTYSHFRYGYVQTAAGIPYHDTWLPNSPQHQLYLDSEYKITAALTVGAALEYVSSWYVDSTNRVFLADPTLYPNVYYGRTDPYALVHVRLAYRFQMGRTPFELMLSGRNIFGVDYYGFTEPDPDGNSYQPAPTAEWSLGLRVGVGKTD
jgi:iron complex outermembrane receptor protein